MGSGPSVMSGNNWKRLSVIRDERRPNIPVAKKVSMVLMEKDYHFMPCVACISLWSGKRLESPAFPEKQAPPPPPEPPRSPTSKVAAQTELPPPEEEEKPKKREVENKYNTEGGVRLILGAREGGVRIFESSTRELLQGGNVKKRLLLVGNIYAHEGQVHCVKLYDDANSAVSFGQDAKIIIYDFRHRQILHEISTAHRGAILCGDISSDLKYMLSGGVDGHLFLWDLEKREKLCTMGTIPKDKTRKQRAIHEKVLDKAKPWELGKEPRPGGKLHTDAVKCTAFVREAPTNRVISGGWDNNLLVWDLKLYASFTKLEGHRARITGCATSYETRYCCTVSEDKTLRVWDIEDRVCTAVLEEHHGMIFSCHMSSWEIYEPLLLSCGADGELKVWDVRKQEYRDALVGHYDSCVACSIQQDGQYGVSVGQDGIVRVWKIREFIDLNITLIVGEGGSGITRDYALTVDPQDDVYSAKEQLRLVSDTPLSYNKDGEPKFHVPDPKFRGLQADAQAWTALLETRKKFLDPAHQRLNKFGVTSGCSVTVVRQMSKAERLAAKVAADDAKELAKNALAGHDDDDDHSPGVSPTVQRRQALLKRQEGGKIDPNKSFKAKQGNLTKLRKEGGLLNVDVDEGEQEG